MSTLTAAKLATLASAQAYWHLVELDAKTYKLLLRQVQNSRRESAA